MNARLIVQTLHRAAAVPLPKGDADPLRPLGDGLDGFFVRMRPDVCQPTPESRLLRYVRALHYSRTASDRLLDEVRRGIGRTIQDAWIHGRRPNLRLTAPMRLRPVGLR